MDIERLLYDRFISPMKRSSKPRIGVEFEFPLLNLTNLSNKKLINFLFHRLQEKGFTGLYNNEQLIAVEKENKVRISLDTSYNNLEIAFSPQFSLDCIAHIWQKVLGEIKQIIYGRGLLLDLGINPLLKILDSDFIDDVESQLESQLLNTYVTADFHGYSDFFAFISSVQTHLEFSVEELPQAMNTLAKLDFAEIMLFANSPLKTKEGWFRSGRHYLYSRSILPKIGLYGSIEEKLSSVDDILYDYAQRSLFLRWRNQCELLAPVTLTEYYQNPLYEAKASDLKSFYSYHSVELKPYGTLERRIACTQPFAESFAPVAFEMGIAESLPEAEDLVKKFLHDNKILMSNNQLSELAARGFIFKDTKILYDFLRSLWELAVSGLQKRGLGEEKYLDCFEEKFSRIVGWENDVKKLKTS